MSRFNIQQNKKKKNKPKKLHFRQSCMKLVIKVQILSQVILKPKIAKKNRQNKEIIPTSLN